MKKYKLFTTGKKDYLRKDSFTLDEALNVVANVLRVDKALLYCPNPKEDRPQIRKENNPGNVDDGYSIVASLVLIK